jgi:hypothetical protein
MKPIYVLCGIIAIIAYNAFLVHRDNQLYQNESAMRERFCQHLSPSQYHPDCNSK